MYKDIDKLYCYGKTAEELAADVLNSYFKGEKPVIPIDPFKIMRDLGVVYQFMDSKELEGVYLVPEYEGDIPIVGININRPITRQRFTAAHELCHHIKDKNSEVCAIKEITSSGMERYAEQFAAALLMPKNLLYEYAQSFMTKGHVSMEDALSIAEHFGVSFNACVRRLAYNLRILPFENNTQLSKDIKNFKPDKQKVARGIDRENIDLLKQVVDSYAFCYEKQDEFLWYKFKHSFLYNENRMEGLKLDREDVAEIVTDLRMNKQDSEYCKSGFDDIIQVLGHSEIYEYILATNDHISAYRLLDLNKMLFKYAPYPEESGKTRDSNTLVLGAKFESYDYTKIPMALYDLDVLVQDAVSQKDLLSVSGFISKIAVIHHLITKIHPFRDGNGRCSRAFLNWMLRLKKLPPIYIKVKDKETYYTALKIADSTGNCKELERVIIHELFNTIMRLNKV